MFAVSAALASLARVVRARTQRPDAWAMIIASGTGASAMSVSGASIASIATTNDSEKSTVSQVSMVNSRRPTPSTSTSPVMRAICSPMDVLCRSASGRDSAPRRASARRLARMRVLAVISHQRLSTRGPSVSSVPAISSRAASVTSSRVAAPRSSASTLSIALPSRMAGRITAVFITMPASEPMTSCPVT